MTLHLGERGAMTKWLHRSCIVACCNYSWKRGINSLSEALCEFHFIPLTALAERVKLFQALARRVIKLLHRPGGNFWVLCGLRLVQKGITSDVMDLGPLTSVVGPLFQYTPCNTTLPLSEFCSLHDTGLIFGGPHRKCCKTKQYHS